MVDPTLTLAIDRTSLSLSPLVFSAAEDGNTWGIVRFVRPGKQARITYASDSPFVHGSLATSAVWQQGLMAIDLVPSVTSEVDYRAAVAELEAALGQFSYALTETTNGQPDVWRCDMGSITPPTDGRGITELRDFDPVFSVTIPVYPVSA